MGKIHQIGDEYFIEFYARGLLYQQKAGKDLSKAKELLSSIEAKLAKGEMLTMARDIELDVFFSEFLKIAGSQYHPATVARLKSTIEHFLKFIRTQCPHVTHLSKVTPRVIEDYKAHGIKLREIKSGVVNPKVINLTLLLLREIFEHGIKTGFINDNPTLHVRLLKVDGQSALIMTDDQFKELLKGFHETFQDMFQFMRYTGLRPTELVDLRWQQVDLNRNVIFVRLREVPLMSRAKAILDKLSLSVIDHKACVFVGPAGETVDVGMLHEAFANARSLLDLSAEISLNHLRKAFVCGLLRRRVSFLMIAKIAGVADVAKLMFFSDHIPVGAPGDEG